MDDRRKMGLEKYRNDFRNEMIVRNIIPSLHKGAGGFLDEVEQDRVTSKEKDGKAAQVDELVDILLTKGKEDFDRFCTVVGGNDAMLAKKLREAAEPGPPQGCKLWPDIHFSPKPGGHLVQESIWDDLKSAVVCIHHFTLPYSLTGVLVGHPAELKRMIEESDERLLRDRILRYPYWFCYMEVDQYVELKGSAFVAEHVRVEYSVERDIISFPVVIATIEAKLAECGQQLQPIPLDNVKAPQGRGAGHVWTDCTAIVYSFPLGKPLSHSAGKVVDYIEPTDKKTERIAYQMRMEGCSSGGPVFVTLGKDNPVVVVIHSESGVRTDAVNKGDPLCPFLQRTCFKKIDNSHHQAT